MEHQHSSIQEYSGHAQHVVMTMASCRERTGEENGTSNINPHLVFCLCQPSYCKREAQYQRKVGGIHRINPRTRVLMGVLKDSFMLM